jgi:hypothetical protein
MIFIPGKIVYDKRTGLYGRTVYGAQSADYVTVWFGAPVEDVTSVLKSDLIPL